MFVAIVVAVMSVSVAVVGGAALGDGATHDQQDTQQPNESDFGSPVDSVNQSAQHGSAIDEDYIAGVIENETDYLDELEEPSLEKTQMVEPESSNQTTSAGIESDEEDDGPEPVPFHSGEVLLDEGVHGPVSSMSVNATASAASGELQWMLVQFSTSEYDDEFLLEEGYEFAEYLHSTAHYAGIPAENVTDVAGHPDIHAVSEIRPEWRTAPKLEEEFEDEDRVSISVDTFETISYPSLEQVGDTLYRGDVTQSEFQSLRNDTSVYWMAPYVEPRPALFQGNKQAAGSGTHVDLPHTGDGVTVGVIDSGIMGQHEHFSDVDIEQDEDYTPHNNFADDCDHGTHVAATVTGSSEHEGVTLTGIAPDADLVDTRIFINETNHPNRQGDDCV